jgi:hypothetical protein
MAKPWFGVGKGPLTPLLSRYVREGAQTPSRTLEHCYCVVGKNIYSTAERTASTGVPLEMPLL